MSWLRNIGGRLYRGEISFDFVGRQRLWYTISGLILVISIVALFARGLDYSVDFKGGAVYQFPARNATITQITSTVASAGVANPLVQEVHGLNGRTSWQVQTSQQVYSQTVPVQKSIAKAFGLSNSAISVQLVGPSWGSQITHKAAEALIAFLIVIVAYLTIAFEWRMAAAAFVALAHDIVITIGVYALTGFQVSPATVIGLLTILGYSLYDTVVVFDKVRENTAGLLATRRSNYSTAANLALNQTLVRSINTSLIALLPVAAILVVAIRLLGNGELRDLSLVLFVGMLSGTYSSICIATPVLADLKERDPQYKQLAKQVAMRAAGQRARGAAKAAAAGAGASAGGAGAGGAGAAGAGAGGARPGGPAVATAGAGGASGRGAGGRGAGGRGAGAGGASAGGAGGGARGTGPAAATDPPEEEAAPGGDAVAPETDGRVPAASTAARAPVSRPARPASQQPRRSNSARRRSGGKKKRR